MSNPDYPAEDKGGHPSNPLRDVLLSDSRLPCVKTGLFFITMVCTNMMIAPDPLVMSGILISHQKRASDSDGKKEKSKKRIVRAKKSNGGKPNDVDQKDTESDSDYDLTPITYS